jgi:signal transduction histidine kinase
MQRFRQTQGLVSVARFSDDFYARQAAFADVLRLRAGSDEALAKPVQHILNVVRRGQRLTDEILRFTRPAEPRLETIELGSWLPELCEEARGLIGERRLEMKLSGALRVRADADQLLQVVLNLVTNARDATPPDGTITIGAARAEEVPFVRGQVAEDQRLVTLFVRDNGSGIAREALERIFEPLFTKKKSGHGLGLAVAFQIISQHQGQILIETEGGTGSTFHLVLPMAAT